MRSVNLDIANADISISTTLGDIHSHIASLNRSYGNIIHCRYVARAKIRLFRETSKKLPLYLAIRKKSCTFTSKL